MAIAAPALAQVVPFPDSGTADAGMASKAIANVVANDTIDGAPALLGASGNAAIARSGAWPTGLVLNTTSGALTTTTGLAAGVYSVSYKLCDLSSNCAITADTVTVVTPVINPASESGTADFGVGSLSIANIAANDTVNGAQAVLGSSGNARVSQSTNPAWPSGIVLNTSTGAVTTSSTLAVGTYSIAYNLCDRNVPAFCQSTTDTVTVIAPSINPAPDSGTADAGVGSQPIANVAANDTVNGAAATLGPGGNATVSQGTNPAWPSGIVLNTTTGAVTTSLTLGVGTYSIAYNLCDRNSPPVCNSAIDTVTVINPSIVPVAENGIADAGIASQPIANVAANDTVNSAPATLGSGGNATIAQGTPAWPTGMALNPATGAVTTTVAVPAGIYSLAYKLCDRNSPPACNSTADTLTIIAPLIIPNPDSGTATAGVASKPIANVAANDSVNGAQAVLGSSGNATVAQSGTWPSGIALTPSTGAVTTTAAQPPGTYNLSYTLCDRNGPPAACALGSVTINIYAAVVALPIAGSAVVGTSGTPIGFVPMQDLVNNASVVLGTTPNAVLSVAPGGNWPSGFSLDQVAGAISSSPSVPVGTYSLPYQLCDLNSPANCATATATVAITNPYSEVMATATPMGDVEFDWGRDGIHCGTCNFGDGNDRANWTDRSGNLWIAHLDPTSGLFVSPGANDELADTAAYFWNTWGNGPEWAFSTQNGQVSFAAGVLAMAARAAGAATARSRLRRRRLHHPDRLQRFRSVQLDAQIPVRRHWAWQRQCGHQ